tara:strand:- start:1090 stop:1464 length:375 start_codon:yes stop_codon:yes gene_type:complete
MKKLLLILSISFLFSSCFSYKTVSYNNITTEAIETKKRDLMNFLVFSPLPILSNPEFKVKKLDGTNVQGKLVSKNEKAISLKQYGRLQKIPKEDISSIKKRKFSLIKTSIVAIPIIAFGLYDYK